MGLTLMRENNDIDWLDLNVLSNNLPAKNLYLKSGFKIIGEMSDCYRIDSESVSEITMTLCAITGTVRHNQCALYKYKKNSWFLTIPRLF